MLALQINLSHGQEYSELWGKNGEKWTPQSRLPDFSFAGYHCGESPLPDIKAVTDVTKFGAKGDGKTDCTQAFIDAIKATDNGAITIPAGRYIINDIIWIKKSGIVLRGAGIGKTILYFPKTLEDVKTNMGATTSGKPTSNYSWSGGFIWAKGSIRRNSIATITEDCQRGSKTIKIDKTNVELRKGQRVTIEMKDDAERTLLNHIYSGDTGDTAKITKPKTIRMNNRIVSVNDNTITLERPLRLDIRKSWSPKLKTYEPNVSEVGIEDLSIEFPVKPYPGHTFEELGMNGIAMNGVADCWIRNVQISNSDSGIFLAGEFCTADGILIDSSRPDGKGTTGHHGISFGSDCLVENFEFKTHFVHDFTVSGSNNGNVIKNGKGINLSLDHHKRGPYENLLCNIDIGKGNEIWRSGGGQALGKHSAARGTFWCIKTEDNIYYPPEQFGPDSINIVGIKTDGKSIKKIDGKWFEAIPPEKLQPADLHAAQLAKRLKQTPNNK
jgi:ribosomal protein L21E